MTWRDLQHLATDFLAHELDDDLLRRYLPDPARSRVDGSVAVHWVLLDRVAVDDEGTLRAWGHYMATRFALVLETDGPAWQQCETVRRAAYSGYVYRADLADPATWLALSDEYPSAVAAHCRFATSDPLDRPVDPARKTDFSILGVA